MKEKIQLSSTNYWTPNQENKLHFAKRGYESVLTYYDGYYNTSQAFLIFYLWQDHA